MFTKMPAPGQQAQQPPATAGPPQRMASADFLMGRIASQANYSTYTESRVDFPYATGGVSSPSAGQTGGVSEIPLHQIVFYPDTTSYQSGGPLITADGAVVSPTGPGAWGQLRAAGRVR